MAIVVIRLHPREPVDPGDFAAYLDGLRIDISDRSFGDPKGIDPGHLLGSAAYDPTDPNTTIVQHLEAIWGPTAVATAAVDIPDPLPFSEYLTPDLRLTVTRTPTGNPTQTILVKDTNFNVDVVAGALPTSTPAAYSALGPVALYLALPPPLVALPPGTAYLDIPTDGSALPYDAVLGAMQTVVAADPGGALDLATLTATQCRHLAWEMVSNRTLDPLPQPNSLEDLYRKPNDEGARRDFESALLTYYAVHNTRAQVLAKYVYSVSAALACQRLSQNATKVGLTPPVFPGLPFAPGAVPQTSVVVSQ